MSTHPEVNERTLVLTETCLEGLAHMQRQMEDGLHEAALQLYCNVLEAVVQVEASVHLTLKEEEQADEQPEWIAVRDSLNARLLDLADCFQTSRWHDILPLLHRALPEFRLWQQTVQNFMTPKYLV